LAGCVFSKRSPISEFPTSDFLIGVSEFPPGWRISDGPNYWYEFGAFEAIEITFMAETDTIRNGANMAVFKGDSNSEAKHIIQLELEHDVIGEPIADLEKLSIRADQSKNGCFDREGLDPPSCSWYAQYGKYVVYFSTWLIPDYMSLDDMARIIKKIDERMADKLEITATPQ
jgi:hypothetical protein